MTPTSVGLEKERGFADGQHSGRGAKQLPDYEENALLRVGKLAHLDQVLRDLGDTLLALVDRKVRPVLKLSINLVRSKVESTAISTWPAADGLCALQVRTCSIAFV